MSNIIQGVGKDAPVETLPGGGRQTTVPARLELIDGVAMMRVGRVLKEGREKYGEDIPGQEQWKLIPVRAHLNKALIHIYSYLAGDTQDEHLDHAFCRIMMAVAVEHNPLKKKEEEPVLKDEGFKLPFVPNGGSYLSADHAEWRDSRKA